MSAKSFTLTNDFHGTQTTVRVAADKVRKDHDGRRPVLRVTLSNAQYRRARKALCGMHDCTCGGIRDHRCEPTSGEFDTCDYDVFVREAEHATN